MKFEARVRFMSSECTALHWGVCAQKSQAGQEVRKLEGQFGFWLGHSAGASSTDRTQELNLVQSHDDTIAPIRKSRSRMRLSTAGWTD